MTAREAGGTELPEKAASVPVVLSNKLQLLSASSSRTGVYVANKETPRLSGAKGLMSACFFNSQSRVSQLRQPSSRPRLLLGSYGKR